VDVVTEFLIDTVALVRYLEDTLPKTADAVFDQGEQGKHRLLLPQIALGEFIYIALRGRVKSAHSPAAIEEAVQNILSSDFISVTTMPTDAWNEFLRLEIGEMHDRLIVAEALARGVPLISSDPAFQSVPALKLVWK
jgi:predicted nucleic acid-binding protein